MADLKSLVANRGVYKSQLTRFSTFLDNIQVDNSKMDEVQARLDKLELVFSKFADVQTQIELLDNAQTQHSERDEFEDKYFSLVARAKKHLPLPSNQNQREVAPTVAGAQKDVVLPKIKLPEFSGSYEKWYGFHDTFRTLIHNNANLNNIQKYQYLQAALKGEAAELIQSLEVSETNYTTAWDLLKKRYENKKVIIRTHMREIFDLPNINSSSSAIRQFTDNFEKHFRALKNLEIPVETWDTILIYLLTNKLDPASKKEWEVKTNDKVTPTMNEFIDFLANRCRLLESLENKQTKQTITTTKKVEYKSQVHATTVQQHNPSCAYCKESHHIFYCKKFLALSISDRHAEAKKLKLCINCLKKGHIISECFSRGCKICQKKHNSLLHFENNSNNSSSNLQSLSSSKQGQTIAQENVISNHCSQISNTLILLSTAKIYVFDSQNNPLMCRCLLDSGSQSNFISYDLFKKLNLKSFKINMPVVGINSAIVNISKQVSISIESVHSAFNTRLNFLILDKITEDIPQFTFPNSLNIPSDIKLADPSFYEAGKVDILLGAGVFYELLKGDQIRLGKGQPILQNSELGWIISGPVGTSITYNARCNLSTNYDIQDQIEKFWLVEQGPLHKSYTKEESECEQNFTETFRRDAVTGRFSVNLSLRENYDKLGESKDIAVNRFYGIERKFAKNNDLKMQYSDFMEEYKTLGHMTQILDSERVTSNVHFYLPHHCVINNSSITTKLRVVFDGSSKSTSGLSLNDILKVGPSVQDDLFSILIRLRKHNVVLTADIAKMYRQIEVEPRHRDLQRIVWRSDPSQPLQSYQLNTVTYGTSPASFLATRCLKQIALEHQSDYPTAAQIILQDFYVDDLITGTCDIPSAQNLIHELNIILGKACFELRKWNSNNPLVFSNIPQKSNLQNYIISSEQSCKTLGIIWNPTQDDFRYTTSSNQIENSCTTKRQVLSILSQIFDPLGLLGPVVVKAKLILQQLWLLKLGWDDSIPEGLLKSWQTFLYELPFIKQISIQRQVVIPDLNLIEIHAFSDSSLSAYGTCLYIKSISHSNDVMVRLLTAKSRVAPIKTLTIPRLELCGALLMAQLVEKLTIALKLDIKKIFYYTDSTIVLCWLRLEPSRLKSFVSHRVAEIQRLTKQSQWFHVSSDDNPADVLSRGMTPSDLARFPLWWNGPTWLQTISEPENETLIINEPTDLSDIPEMKSGTITNISTSPFHSDFFDYFSSFTKLQRITAYCLRFINKLRKIQTHSHSGKLTIQEINDSTTRLVKLVQIEAFSSEIQLIQKGKPIPTNSKLVALSPFMDESGVLRVGGRLRHSSLPYNHKFPIILPAKHKFTNLVVEYEHIKTLHSGIQTTLSSIRLTFWPINGKQVVRNLIRKCVKCFKANPYPISQKMGDLPSQRVVPARPFAVCGVDYAGPFLIRDGKLRNRKCVKGYICLFICFTSKAVHLELVSDLTTNSFLNALKRFSSRRGLCQQIFSDNATNFHGADNELKRLAKMHSESKVRNYLDENKITWNFIPAKSPHHGGLWESAIKTAKYYLKRVSCNANLTYEEFFTLLCQIEAIMNSCPLCPLSSDPTDFEPLTPGHFLIGSALNALPQPSNLETKSSRLSRYEYVQKLSEQFWKTWSRTYLHNLQQRTKWKFAKNTPNLIGSLVLLKKDGLPPQRWLLGRIVAVHPGKDGLVRVVSVKTRNGVFKRATVKVCLLPIT